MNLDRFHPPTLAESRAEALLESRLERAWMDLAGSSAFEVYQSYDCPGFSDAVDTHLGLDDEDAPAVAKYIAGRTVGQIADEIGFDLETAFEADWINAYEPY